MFNKNDFINWNLQAKRSNPENIDYTSSSFNPMRQIRKVENINEASEELDEVLGMAIKGLGMLSKLRNVAPRALGLASKLKGGVGKSAGKIKGLVGRGGSKGASKGAEQTSKQVADRATEVAKLPTRQVPMDKVPMDMTKPFGQRITASTRRSLRVKRAKLKVAKQKAAKIAKEARTKRHYASTPSKVIQNKGSSVPRTTPAKPSTTAPTTASTTAPTTGGAKGAIDAGKTRLTKWSANQNKLGDRIVKGIAKKGAKLARTKTGKVIIGAAIARKALSDAAASSRKKTWYPGMQQQSTNYHGNERLDELISVLSRDGMQSNRAYLGGLRDAYKGAKATNYDMKRKIVNWDRMGRDSKSRYSDEEPSTAPKKPKQSALARAKAQLSKVKDTMKAAKKGIISRKVFDNTGGI